MKPFWKEMKNLMICVCVHRIFSKENAYVQWHTFYDDRTTAAEERERESKKINKKKDEEKFYVFCHIIS